MTISATVSQDHEVAALWPLGAQERKAISFAPRLQDLDGKVVAELWSWMWGGDVAYALVRDELRKRFPNIEIIPFSEFGNLHGPDEDEVVAALPMELKRRGVDAVILGIANCGSCTPAVLRAHVACEQAGFPSVSIVGEPFVGQAEAVADYLNVAGAAMAVYPGHIEVDDAETFGSKVLAALPDQIVRGLTAGTPKTSEETVIHQPRDVAIRGTLDEVIEHFHDKQWTDGLPFVPPTIERVGQFLAHTDRDPDEVIATLRPSLQQATVWTIAIHGVMAGCRPEYMPVLIAAVEAITAPEFNFQHQSAAPSWEMLAILSGPVARQLDMNFQHGVCSVGRRANSSIGRFLRLYSRNIAGFRIPPGATDYASFGNSFFVAIAEDEDCVRELGWKTFGEDRGLAAGESGVTVQGVVAVSPTFFDFGGEVSGPAERLAPLVDVFGQAMCGYWGFTGAVYGQWHPLVLINPDMARLIASEGWTKDTIRAHLYDSCRITARELERRGEVMNLDLAANVRAGILPAVYHESDDPDRSVPLFVRPEWINIVVCGAPTTCFRGYMNSHEQGVPVTRSLGHTSAPV